MLSEGKSKRQSRRHRLLVDEKLQLRLVAASLGYVAFYVAVMTLATFMPLIIEFRSVNPNSNRAYLLANSFIYLHRHIWIVVPLVFLAVALHSLLLSHRVAGPLYRFRQVFLSLSAGRLPGRQQLRKRDYLQSEMELVNKMLQSLHSTMADLEETQKAIADSISRISQRNRALSDSELTLLVEELEAQGKRLARNVLLFEKES
jgi:methyl-accepting chemotaxis protein